MREDDELLRELAVAAATATFQNLSIIGALAEHHLVDQGKVADWAEFFASELEKSATRGPANLEHVRRVAARRYLTSERSGGYSREIVSISSENLSRRAAKSWERALVL